jgi:hypothetical protein
LAENINTIKTEVIIDANMEVGLEVNAEKNNVHVSSPDHRTKQLYKCS